MSHAVSMQAHMVAVERIDKRIYRKTIIQRTNSAGSKQTTYSRVVDTLMGSERTIMREAVRCHILGGEDLFFREEVE